MWYNGGMSSDDPRLAPGTFDHLKPDEGASLDGPNITYLWGQPLDMDKASVSERMGLVWELTVEHWWVEKGENIRNRKMDRTVGGVYNLKTNPPPDWYE